MMTEPELKLLKAARNGDMDAFAALFEPMRPTLVRVAGGIVGDSDAEDVVMDAMLKAWRALPGFRQGAALRSWTIRIVRNAAFDALRSRSRKREVPLDESDDDTDKASLASKLPDPTVVHPGDAMGAEERRGEVALALEKLEPHHREVLELRYMDDLSYHEIAEATGVLIGTVMSRLFYAKRKLARLAEVARLAQHHPARGGAAK